MNAETVALMVRGAVEELPADAFPARTKAREVLTGDIDTDAGPIDKATMRWLVDGVEYKITVTRTSAYPKGDTGTQERDYIIANLPRYTYEQLLGGEGKHNAIAYVDESGRVGVLVKNEGWLGAAPEDMEGDGAPFCS